jgi:hypothetical protein
LPCTDGVAETSPWVEKTQRGARVATLLGLRMCSVGALRVFARSLPAKSHAEVTWANVTEPAANEHKSKTVQATFERNFVLFIFYSI